MAINPIASAALKAYGIGGSTTASQTVTGSAAKAGSTQGSARSFTETITDSIAKVNDMQQQKNSMVEAFASGENQNVHELMITLQKAGLAMNLTSTVRNKIMSAYQEIMRMSM